MQAKRDLSGWGLAALNRIAGWPLMRRTGIKTVTERVLFHGARTGFQLAGTGARAFRKVRGGGTPTRLPRPSSNGLFDLTPSDEQQMLCEAVRDVAMGELRPAAAAADMANAAPEAVTTAAANLGIHLLDLPETLGGAGQERSVVTQVLVSEALAQGDLGLAVACLAPQSVMRALVNWGDADQQATYLPAFAGERPPVTALALAEPGILQDPLSPTCRAERSARGYRLSGEKALVIRGTEAELLLVSATIPGEGAGLFLVEGGHRGLRWQPEPAMGLRAAGTVRLQMSAVDLPAEARLGDADILRDCVRLSRLAWCALGCGAGRAVLDYVIPYVNERQAFGEPISHRQSVAFIVANMAIELEGMRLATLRAASRIDLGQSHAREVALARRLCSEKGMQIGNDGVQLLGGHGFTREYPVERWYRDLRAVAVMDGGVLV